MTIKEDIQALATQYTTNNNTFPEDTDPTLQYATELHMAEEARQTTETTTRDTLYTDYQTKYPDIINNDILNNDIPPRLIKNLEEGRVDYKGFLDSCVNYMSKTKVLKKEPIVTPAVDLSDLEGGDTPSGDAQQAENKQTYASEVW